MRLLMYYSQWLCCCSWGEKTRAFYRKAALELSFCMAQATEIWTPLYIALHSLRSFMFFSLRLELAWLSDGFRIVLMSLGSWPIAPDS